jgi:histidine ammonia-lyase
MMLEYVAASALGEVRAAAAPAGLQSVALSRGVEDDASFASQAARQGLRAGDNLAIVLACELVAAVRAVRMRRIEPSTALLTSALSVCETLSDAVVDRDLTADLEVAAGLLPQLAALLSQV